MVRHGYEAGEFLAEVGVYTGGGRQPDLTVWTDVDSAQPEVSAYCGTTGLLLAIEVVSPSSEVEDKIRKRAEYARAGIPRYWIIEQDKPQTVTMYRLGDDGTYVAALPSPQPLSWLLTTDPSHHHSVRPRSPLGSSAWICSPDYRPASS